MKTGRPDWSVAAAAAIVAAAAAAYANSFHGPFVLDDVPSVIGNPTIRHLERLREVLSPPGGEGLTVEGRPMLNLSLAVCYAISGTDVWSYHAFNLMVHVSTALVLFGTLLRVPWRESANEGGVGTGFAFAVALLWAVHPLNTEAVTYVIQRSESLMGLFYVLSIYCFIRGSNGGRHWLAASVAACACGMATKEVMVSAPLIILAVDRVFVSGSVSGALRGRRVYYGCLFATWTILIWLVVGSGNRGGTTGFGSGVTFAQYWLTQPGTILHYLRLCFLPVGLVFDYGTEWVTRPESVAPAAAVVAFLALATAACVARRPRLPTGEVSLPGLAGLLGLLFFAVLAPTSLMPGNRQTAAEQRMYLPLIPVLVAFVGLFSSCLRGLSKRRIAVGALLLASPLAMATHFRNRDYSTVLGLYAKDAERMPQNAFAQANVGVALLEEGRTSEAADHLRKAVALRPFYPIAHEDLGNAYFRLGQHQEAEVQYRISIRQDPFFAESHGNLGQALIVEGKIGAAIEELGRALELDPSLDDVRAALACALARDGRISEAGYEFAKAVKSRPGDARAYNNFANALASANRQSEAIHYYREAIRLSPDTEESHYNLANALYAMNDLEQARVEYRRALGINPRDAAAHNNLGNLLLDSGLVREAVAEFEASLEIDGTRATTHYNLGNALLRLDHLEEAAVQFREALRLRPDLEPAASALRGIDSRP